MSLLITMLMIVLGVAAVLLVRLDPDQAKWARPVAVLCAIVTVALAVENIRSTSRRGQAVAVIEAHVRYQEACGTVLGQDLARRYAGAHIVILTPPRIDAAAERRDGAMVENLQLALQEAAASVVVMSLEIPEEIAARFRAVPEEGSVGQPPYPVSGLAADTSMWFDTRRLAALLEDLNTEAGLVISTVNVAMGVQADLLPKPEQAPALVLLNTWMDNVAGALSNSVLDTIVLNRINADAFRPGATAPRDVQKAFKKRFFLVRADNVADLAGQHPQL